MSDPTEKELQDAHNQGEKNCSECLEDIDRSFLDAIFSSLRHNPPSDPELEDAYEAGWKHTWDQNS